MARFGAKDAWKEVEQLCDLRDQAAARGASSTARDLQERAERAIANAAQLSRIEQAGK